MIFGDRYIISTPTWRQPFAYWECVWQCGGATANSPKMIKYWWASLTTRIPSTQVHSATCRLYGRERCRELQIYSLRVLLIAERSCQRSPHPLARRRPGLFRPDQYATRKWPLHDRTWHWKDFSERECLEQEGWTDLFWAPCRSRFQHKFQKLIPEWRNYNLRSISSTKVVFGSSCYPKKEWPVLSWLWIWLSPSH